MNDNDISRSLQQLDVVTIRTADHIRDGLRRMEKIAPLNIHEKRLALIAADMERMVTGAVS